MDGFKVQIALFEKVFTLKPVADDKEVLLTVSNNEMKMDGTALDSTQQAY